jgi:hypothetical protein
MCHFLKPQNFSYPDSAMSNLDMHFRYITPLLVAMPMLFSAGTAWGCLMDAPLVGEEDLKYPPANAIAFKAVITKIIFYDDLDRGKPRSGFQLKLKITKVYQGANLGDTIAINYGGCHNLPGKQGSVINVLALPSKEESWYAPQFWYRSNDPQNKRECAEGNTYYGYKNYSDRTFIPDEKGEAYGCFSGHLIPLGYDPRKLKQ